MYVLFGVSMKCLNFKKTTDLGAAPFASKNITGEYLIDIKYLR